jgi:DNA-directed RNA polymerase subunit alpha
MGSIAFQIPGKISVRHADDFHGIFTFRPLERGYGITIGNALRRVLLASLEGYAITSIRIPGIHHEFSSIEGVTEDLVEIILNLKQVRFKKVIEAADNKIFMSVSNKKVLKAGDFSQVSSAFEVTNPDLVICHVDENARFEIELTIEKGHGYIPAEENRKEGDPKGVIPIDSIFTPIKKVEYHVENTRVGEKTDYESLILSVQTDGTIHPQTAVEIAADIMIKHFSLLVDKTKIVEAKEVDELSMLNTDMLQMRKLLKTTLLELHQQQPNSISKRIYNCLKANDIKSIADIVKLSFLDIKQFRNFGDVSSRELEEFVKSKGLSFGMDLTPYNLNDQ